jgi:hypothetical protein
MNILKQQGCYQTIKVDQERERRVYGRWGQTCQLRFILNGHRGCLSVHVALESNPEITPTAGDSIYCTFKV